MSTLALEFRPVRFADVIGQNPVREVLMAIVRDRDVPPAFLFSGSQGTGKTSMMRIFAAALNCAEPTEKGDACAECESCQATQAGRSLMLLEVDAASHGLIDHVRSIQNLVSYDTGGFRVVAFDEAHSMSRPAFNALLKVLEEPPPQTTFVLLTTEAGRVPDTVASRAMPFEFRRVPTDGIRSRLATIAQAKGIEVEPDLLTEIAIRSEGGMRDAVMTLDQCSRVGVAGVAGFRELFGIMDVGLPLFRAALFADHVGGTKLIADYFHRVGDAQGMVTDLVEVARDLIVLVAGGEPEVTTQAALDERRELAGQLEIAQLVGAVRVLWELKARTRAVDGDQRSQMEMAFVLLTEALRLQQPIQQVGETPRREPMTLEALEALVVSFPPVGGDGSGGEDTGNEGTGQEGLSGGSGS